MDSDALDVVLSRVVMAAKRYVAVKRRRAEDESPTSVPGARAESESSDEESLDEYSDTQRQRTVERGKTVAASLPQGWEVFGEGGDEYFGKLALIQEAFAGQKAEEEGILEEDFVRYIAPALTLSNDAYENKCLAARLDVNANGIIMFDEFSSHFVERRQMSEVQVVNSQFYYGTGGKHHSSISKILFSRQQSQGPSWNPLLDRYCVTGGYDGSVHLWDSSYFDHVERMHFIPEANKQHRWIQDMCFTGTGKLALAQSRGYIYVYSVVPRSTTTLQRVLKTGKYSSGSDIDEIISAQVEKRKYSSTSRVTASNVPSWEVCTLDKTGSADITCVTGVRSVVGQHVDPLAIGLETGGIHMYNVTKPVDIVPSIAPMWSFSEFNGGRVLQLFDDTPGESMLVLGAHAPVDGVTKHAIRFIDYEKMVPTLSLEPREGQRGGTLLRFDYDCSTGILLASGCSRVATIFSSSFPEPVAYLDEHTAPIVGAAINADYHQMYTVTDNGEFHLFDMRMNRKVQTIADNKASEIPFSAAAFDGTRRNIVAGSNVPVGLRETITGMASSPSVGTPSPNKDLAPPPPAQHKAACYNTQFSQVLVSGSETVQVLDGSSMEQIDEFAIGAIPFMMKCDASGRRFGVLSYHSLYLHSMMTGMELLDYTIDIPSKDEATALEFGVSPGVGACLCIGTYCGTLIVLDDVISPKIIHQRSLSQSGIIDIAAVSNRSKIILATTHGDVFQCNLEGFSAFRVTRFHLVHPIREPSPEIADDLMHFSLKAYKSMNCTCEAVVKVNENHFCLLYGTGIVCLCRVANLETTVVCTFPTTPEGVSASCLAVNSDFTVCVGDFFGNVSVFSMKGYFHEFGGGGPPVPGFFAPQLKRDGIWMYDYVEMLHTVCISPDNLLNDLYAVENTHLCICVKEFASVGCCTLEGELSSSNGPANFGGSADTDVRGHVFNSRHGHARVQDSHGEYEEDCESTAAVSEASEGMTVQSSRLRSLQQTTNTLGETLGISLGETVANLKFLNKRHVPHFKLPRPLTSKQQRPVTARDANPVERQPAEEKSPEQETKEPVSARLYKSPPRQIPGPPSSRSPHRKSYQRTSHAAQGKPVIGYRNLKKSPNLILRQAYMAHPPRFNEKEHRAVTPEFPPPKKKEIRWLEDFEDPSSLQSLRERSIAKSSDSKGTRPKKIVLGEKAAAVETTLRRMKASGSASKAGNRVFCDLDPKPLPKELVKTLAGKTTSRRHRL